MGFPMSPLRLDTGAVIVTHRRADLARLCVERVLQEIDPRSIVVVVNDPDNAPKPELDWLVANVGLVVFNEIRRGYGANLNEGTRRLRGRCRYYLLLNDDVQLERGSIGALRSVLESDQAIALVAPQLVGANGQRQQVTYRFPSIGSELASALILPARLQRRLWGRFVLGGNDSPSAIWLVGAALLARASAFHAIDGFDEQFFLYSEETDLGFRMRERGWSARASTEIVAVHLGGESTVDRHYRRLIGVSRWKYIREHWSRRERVVLPALLALAYLWNSLYVLGRIILEPWSFRDKLSLWALHWEKRPRAAPRIGAMG
jgi:N-acetylglucosaminyl-diphospho-decaprenol L-rhamnosyltransferase